MYIASNTLIKVYKVDWVVRKGEWKYLGLEL